MADRKLRIGVAGLGRAFALMLPTFTADPRVELVAAAAPRAQSREKFTRDFSARTYDSVEELCADQSVDVVYVATPHQDHAAHVLQAARHGKHVLVEKPMAITLDECRTMNEAARAANVHLIVGHSHSFDAPIARARAIGESGAYGKVRMITALNYTDFLYRPRRPEELDTSRGGGVVFSQAAHQIDIVRLLGGGLVKSVRAATGNWDSDRSTEGAYSALLTFADGAFASIVYSGYGHFDSDEFTGWTGELGRAKDPARYGVARRALRDIKSSAEEAALKSARNYAGADDVTANAGAPAPLHEHFGLLLVSCEKADLRPQPDGVTIYSDFEKKFDPLPAPKVPRVEVIDELYDAVVNNRAPVHSGEWALATTEVCLALLRSARESREIALEHQIAPAR